MSSESRIRSLCVPALVLLAAPLLAAQDTGRSREAAQAKPATLARPASAAALATIQLPVAGLSKENQEKVQASLGALTHKLWACPGCKEVQKEAGTCPSCEEELVSESFKLLGGVKADTERGGLSLTLNPGMTLKLSEVERALASASVKVDNAKLALAGSTRLHVQGPGSAEAAKKLEETLAAAKLFDSVKIEHAAKARDYHIVARAGATAPMHAAVASAIERAGEGFRLADVSWVAPKQVS